MNNPERTTTLRFPQPESVSRGAALGNAYAWSQNGKTSTSGPWASRYRSCDSPWLLTPRYQLIVSNLSRVARKVLTADHSRPVRMLQWICTTCSDHSWKSGLQEYQESLLVMHFQTSFEIPNFPLTLEFPLQAVPVSPRTCECVLCDAGATRYVFWYQGLRGPGLHWIVQTLCIAFFRMIEFTLALWGPLIIGWEPSISFGQKWAWFGLLPKVRFGQKSPPLAGTRTHFRSKMDRILYILGVWVTNLETTGASWVYCRYQYAPKTCAIFTGAHKLCPEPC